MSNPPPSDAPASRSPGTPRGDDDPWNLQRILGSLPHELQQLLSDIMRTCHSLCSGDTEAANAVTRDVYRLLLQRVAAIEATLESDPSSDFRTSTESWHLLGRLVDAINHHFQVRPRIMFVSEDADMQSAADAARGIKACITRFIELLSSDEDRAANVAAFTICLMDTDGDAETSMLFVDIAAALQHQVHEDGIVVWTASPQRRLAALAQLPKYSHPDIVLSDSVAYGVLRSCLVAEADVAAAALRSGCLSAAIEVIPRAEAMEWFAQSLHARVGCPSIAQPGCTMKCDAFHVLVTLTLCLQAAAAVLIADNTDIVTAAAQGDFDLVLLHLIADPASANQRDDEYNTRPYTTYTQKFIHDICFVCNVLIRS
jgi:hypothetical protein